MVCKEFKQPYKKNLAYTSYMLSGQSGGCVGLPPLSINSRISSFGMDG